MKSIFVDRYAHLEWKKYMHLFSANFNFKYPQYPPRDKQQQQQQQQTEIFISKTLSVYICKKSIWAE